MGFGISISEDLKYLNDYSRSVIIRAFSKPRECGFSDAGIGKYPGGGAGLYGEMIIRIEERISENMISSGRSRKLNGIKRLSVHGA